MDRDADALYGLPRDAFIARRGELAKSLRKERRRDEAAAVAALRKPSVAAWAVNQLVRTQRSSVQELFDAGDALRDAQSDLLAGHGDGRALRTASERERAAVEDLVERARGLLSSAGDELSPAVIERVADTLHAAALDEEARDEVRDGRLERELRHAGLGLGLGESALVAPQPRRPRPSSSGAPAAAAEAAESKGRAGTERDGAEREGSRSQSTRGEAKRERERAEAERAAAEQARRERAAAVKAARAAEVAAKRRADVAARALAAAEADREQAAQALSAAEAALAAAREDAARTQDAHEQARAELEEAERRR